MGHHVTLLPGDGIGPEVAAAMKLCVEATGVKITWDEQPVGEHAIQKFKTPLPDQALELYDLQRFHLYFLSHLL